MCDNWSYLQDSTNVWIPRLHVAAAFVSTVLTNRIPVLKGTVGFEVVPIAK